MQQKDIRFGIVGCGMISEFHAEAIGQIPNTKITAFCDNNKNSAEIRASQFGGEVYTDVEEMLKNSDIDIVSICTPSGVHMEAAVAAAEAKKHVIVEKPIEVTLERTDKIIEACKKNKVRLGAIFPRRFLDSSCVLKKAIMDNRFGTIVLADVSIKWFRTQEYYSKGGWRGTYKLDGGGALMNQGIHGIDLLQWLMGGVEEVSAFTGIRAHFGIEVEDVAVTSVKFKNGALGVIEGTTGSWPGENMRIEISGTDGIVIMEDEIFCKWQFKIETEEDNKIRERFGQKKDIISGGATDPKAISSEGHRRQFVDFIEAIRADRQPQIDGAEARSAVSIITSIYKSAKEKKTIVIE